MGKSEEEGVVVEEGEGEGVEVGVGEGEGEGLGEEGRREMRGEMEENRLPH